MGRLLQGGGGAFHVSYDVLRRGTATTTWSWFKIKTRSYWSTSGKTAHIHTTLYQHQHSRERAAHSWEFMWWTICPGPCTPSKPMPALFWRLKRLHLSPDVITTSYRGTVESVRWQAACLSGQRAAVLQTKREECRGQQRGLFTLPSVEGLAKQRCLCKNRNLECQIQLWQEKNDWVIIPGYLLKGDGD